MILYSKSGEFLGIGKDELSFLGYEDLDEFKSIHNDVADLFINRPGYIFKFKNFSWIDYALHSGAPKKSVIVKLKTGNEVEAPLSIKELFLMSPKGTEDIYYSVEFKNNTAQSTSVNAMSNSSFVQQATATEQSNFPPIQDNAISESEEVKEEKTFEKTSYEEDFTHEKEESLEVDFDTPVVQEETVEPALKLKVDENIFQEDEKNQTDIDTTNDYVEEFDEIPKIKVDLEDEQETPSINLTSDYMPEDKETQPTDFSSDYKPDDTEKLSIDLTSDYALDSDNEEIEFNIMECVDELGLDISLLSELITDYMEKLDKNIPKLKKLIDEDDHKNAQSIIYKLKGISDNLHMSQLSHNLEQILKANDIQSKQVELEKFEKLVVKFRGELI